MIEEAYLRRRPPHRSLLSQQRRHARYAVRLSSHQCRSWVISRLTPSLSDVRFAPESGHERFVTACPLGGQSQTHAPQQTTRMWVWVLSDRGGPGHTPMHVRFGPKATVGNPNTIRRFVPGAELSRP
jgi:hypothetical protein